MTLRRGWVPQPALGVGEVSSALRLGTPLHKCQHALATYVILVNLVISSRTHVVERSKPCSLAIHRRTGQLPPHESDNCRGNSCGCSALGIGSVL